MKTVIDGLRANEKDQQLWSAYRRLESKEDVIKDAMRNVFRRDVAAYKQFIVRHGTDHPFAQKWKQRIQYTRTVEDHWKAAAKI